MVRFWHPEGSQKGGVPRGYAVTPAPTVCGLGRGADRRECRAQDGGQGRRGWVCRGQSGASRRKGRGTPRVRRDPAPTERSVVFRAILVHVFSPKLVHCFSPEVVHTFFPHAYGWTEGASRCAPTGVVFPSRLWLGRRLAIVIDDGGGFPHTCGCAPKPLVATASAVPYSPPRRAGRPRRGASRSALLLRRGPPWPKTDGPVSGEK